MTARGRFVLALGVVVYLAAWAFGSKPLYPVAAGLLVVSVLAWLWVHAARGPFRLERRIREHDLYEGDDASVRLKLAAGRPALATVEIVERLDRLGVQRHVLRRFGRALRIDYVLCGLRRGRYAYDDVAAELTDPFGLQRIRIPLPSPGAILVYPRVVPLQRLFSDLGSQALDGRRLLVRRHAGFDLHSVREYVEGESLRRVHWPSTARRGRLMVRDLEDAPRDELAVLLDADARAVVGESFEAQVRAAASILAAQVERGRRSVVVVNSARPQIAHVHNGGSEWQRALDLFAAVQPDANRPLASLLGSEANVPLRALELAVVTARIDATLVSSLVQSAAARRRVSLVYIDAPTFAGAKPCRLPDLLRLPAAGVPVAIVRAGEDLGRALEGGFVEAAAHA